MRATRAMLLSVPLLLLLGACFTSAVTPGDGATPSADGATTRDDAGTPPGLDATTPPPDGTLPPAGGELPCAVDAVLRANCQSCHAATPLFGAPMPLVTLADLRAPSRSNPSVPVYQMLARRIHDDRNPMPPPPRARLNAMDTAALDAWVASMAPARPTGDTCGTPVNDGGTPPADGGAPLPCTPTHTFLSHAAGSATAPFEVPRTAGNLYQCFTFRSPFGRTEQATAWAPVIGDARVVHHWILYRTATAQTDGGVGPCNMPSDATFVMGWAPGGGTSVMPPDVGLELRTADPEYLILQVHYNNSMALTDARDRSGVAICTTPTPRAQTAGVLTLGRVPFTIPARSTNYAVTGTCTQRLSVPINILASGPHMHERGVSFRTDIFRGGATGPMVNLVNVPSWSFDNQAQYPHSPVMVAMPGDVLRTTCVYNNPTSSPINFGERTEDEMCFNFAMVYPITAIPAGVPRVCVF